MTSWETDFDRWLQEVATDQNSGQGTLSREIEASVRDAFGSACDALAALTVSDNLRERAQDQQRLAELRVSRSDWLQAWDQTGTIGKMRGYVAHLAIQAAPNMLAFGVGVLIWRAIAKRPLDVLDKAVAGAVLLFFFVFGAFLGSSARPYGRVAYDVSGSLTHTFVALCHGEHEGGIGHPSHARA